MRKIVLFCIASLCSGISMATSNFNSQTGILVIPDVNVDGQTVYDSVTLQLNLGNGTFSVLNANPKPSTIFDTPQEPQFNTEGYTIGLFGCKTSGTNQITCYMQVVNNEADRELWVFADPAFGLSPDSLLFDNLNNTYKAASITYTDVTSSQFVRVPLLFQGIPIKISMVFEGININASSISTFKPAFRDIKSGREFYGTFEDIDF